MRVKFQRYLYENRFLLYSSKRIIYNIRKKLFLGSVVITESPMLHQQIVFHKKIFIKKVH